MTYAVTVTVTYPEMLTGSRETGELHSKYKFVLIKKRSNLLLVNFRIRIHTLWEKEGV